MTEMLRVWSRASLAARLTGWYVAVLALMLVLLATFLYAALSRALEQAAFAQLRAEARDVTYAYQKAIVAGLPPVKAASAAVEDAVTPGVGVVLVGPDGGVLAHSRLPATLALAQPARAALSEGATEWTGYVEAEGPDRQAVVVMRVMDPPPKAFARELLPAEKQALAIRVTAPLDAIKRRIVAPAAVEQPAGPPPVPPGGQIGYTPAQRSDGRPGPPPGVPADGTYFTAPAPPGDFLVMAPPTFGAIQVSLSTSPIQSTLRTTRVLLAGGVLLTLALAALVGGPLTRMGLRPLRSVASASRRLAEGDLTARVPAPTANDEIGELAGAFNHMAERLEASFATQRAFVADASHELRTPLTALGGQLDVLLRAAREDPDEAERLARAMRREVSRTTRLVEDLLVLARLDAQGPAALRVGAVDLAAVARDVYEEARSLPISGERTVVLEADKATPVVGDAARLHQVLLNLVVNALQHAGPGGRVVLRVEAGGGRARAIVQDDGPGIPAEHIERLFDRFYRIEAARTRPAEGGAGLGLAIARAIVEAHGGTVAVENAADGGARFTVALPLDEARRLPSPAPALVGRPA